MRKRLHARNDTNHKPAEAQLKGSGQLAVGFGRSNEPHNASESELLDTIENLTVLRADDPTIACTNQSAQFLAHPGHIIIRIPYITPRVEPPLYLSTFDFGWPTRSRDIALLGALRRAQPSFVTRYLESGLV